MNSYSRSFVYLTASLIMLYCSYIVSVYATVNATFCTILSGIFHYCFLAVVFGFCGNSLHGLVSISCGHVRRFPEYITAVMFSKNIL